MDDIFQAIRLNEAEVYQIMIEQVDIDILDEDGQNLLDEAIFRERTSIGLDLITRKINVNQQDQNGSTPLHYAAMYGNFRLAEAAIKAGGDPNVRNESGNNALWTAVFHARGEYEIVELYKKAGADAQSKNKAGRSPLDLAKQLGDGTLIAVVEMG